VTETLPPIAREPAEARVLGQPALADLADVAATSR
jgi:hypothetical protein